MDWTVAITATTQALGLIKEIRDVDKTFDKAQLKAAMADLYVQVAHIKMALADAQTELREKDEEIDRLSKSLKSKSELIEVAGYKYAINENGKPKGLPFCPRCLEIEGIQIRPANLLADHFKCPHCNALYSGLTEFR